MRTSGKLTASVAALAIGFLSGCGGIDRTTTGSVGKASSVVRVDTLTGHGSGVNIGDIIITAAHVVKNVDTVKIRDDNGVTRVADVLWRNEAHDVAALRVKLPGGIEASDLSCSTPKRGDAVTAAGSPGGEDDLYIPGVIIGNERKTGPWASVVVAAMPATGGISGGPAFDRRGNVVGIVVGGMLGLANVVEGKMDLSQTGIAYIVPGNAICGLLGRVG